MVDLSFVSRATHFIPLALLRMISDSTTLPSEIEYIGEAGFKALQTMDLVKKGRLSVQRVDEKAWNAVVALAEKGGWEDIDLKFKKGKKPSKAQPKAKAAGRGAKETTKAEQTEESDLSDDEDDSAPEVTKPKVDKKRKAKDDGDTEYSAAPRRSNRQKR